MTTSYLRSTDARSKTCGNFGAVELQNFEAWQDSRDCATKSIFVAAYERVVAREFTDLNGHVPYRPEMITYGPCLAHCGVRRRLCDHFRSVGYVIVAGQGRGYVT